jgi:hypothetical protein
MMNRMSVALFPLLLSMVGGLVCAQDPAQKIDLKVLYAGTLDSPRTKDFTDFLGKAFTEVGTVELKSLDQKAAAKFDVVIVDSPSPYGQEADTRAAAAAFKMPAAPELTIDFTKPTILMGAAGGKVVGGLKIKLQWL